ncbi:MAG: hypothetical protein KGK30_09745, partial [Elusimicrobia bacterium]|nr:hypothetical protein [Elusimicrobiota bacterium]
KIEKAKAEKNWRGKYIVLFEEMDKAFELDRDGNQKDRPIMAVVKDLLNNGLASTMSSGGFSLHSRNLDLRRAFIGVTMNFAVDRFGFVADPRFTSAEDVRKVWEDNKKRLWSVKWLMGTMFLPDTVNRLMPKLHIMAPLTEEDYAKVVGLQVDAVANERLGDQEGGNPEHVRLVVTPAYRKYLLQETMVPSEGARYTSVLSRIKIAADLEAALRSMDRRAPYAGKPATITLDYKPRTTTVIGMVVRSDTADKPSQIYKKKVALYFPPMRVSGKISENRLHVSVHEFGHAYTRVRLGQRFESMQVYEPKPGIGGYVKFSGHPRSAGAVLASIYTSLASRALERIFLSPDPLNDRSVLDISPGASSDIQSATRLLYKMLFELGFAP